MKKTTDLRSVPTDELVDNLKILSVEIENVRETESTEKEIMNTKIITTDHE